MPGSDAIAAVSPTWYPLKPMWFNVSRRGTSRANISDGYSPESRVAPRGRGGVAVGTAARRVASACRLGLIVALGLGCSSLESATDTYETKMGSLTPEGPRAVDWSCLGQPPPTAPDDDGGTVTYTFPFVEWVTDTPLRGRSIQVCNRVDPECNLPLPAQVTIIETERIVSVEVPAGQNVFLVLNATGTVPTVLYFDGPLYEDQEGGRIQMLTPDTVGALAQQLQLPLNGELGVIAMRAHDCNGTIVGGARYTISGTPPDSNPYAYTLVNGLPRATFPPTPGVSTTIVSDNSPWSGFINVPRTALTIYGVLDDGMREFGTADIQVRPGHFNAVEVRARDRL